ncbi:MAG: GNAT family N-acetyltransferase [Planctomycetaceae bacterium]|nr:GNAT family N-acetyltransferase [Planctomycetaceae bacterium]
MTTPSPPADVVYAVEPHVSPAEYIVVLRKTTLGERRPVDDPARIARMIDEADVLVTARVDGRLVGISRALTDYSFATYLSDLAVDEQYQGHGIGRELIRRTHAACGKETMLVLIAAPQAETFYPHIGLQQHMSCWFLPRE